MRLMMKGDLAFFYHSNCKVPGIVGIMEIVQEHSVDGETDPFLVHGLFRWLNSLEKRPSIPNIPTLTRNRTVTNRNGVLYMLNSSKNSPR